MKKYRVARFICIPLMVSFSASLLAQNPGEWTWMGGDNAINQPGVYGTKGVASATNKPPSIYEGCEWTDPQGNFWMFGGLEAERYSALWKYNPVTLQWTWVHGDSATQQVGVYGVKGVADDANKPGARAGGSVTWSDCGGNLWMFGGSGLDSRGKNGNLNDLWKYNIASNQWTWVHGSDTCNQSGVYGVRTVPDASNVPGARCETSASWVDDDGNLWMFGGVGNMGSTLNVRFNDLWKYNIATNQWTWMHGNNLGEQAGIYGTKGVPNASNTPGSRYAFASWKDKVGNLWLFGGGIYPTQQFFNDMWRYNIATNEWTWMSGGGAANTPAVFGTRCVPSVDKIPPAKIETRNCWTDACGNFWMFGGYNFQNYFTDLWKYNPTTNEWTWTSGSTQTNQPGVYGTKGVSNAANYPASRGGSLGWIDMKGHLWFFGGLKGGNPLGYLNDLWRFVPDTLCGGCNQVPVPVVSSGTVMQYDTVCSGDSILLTVSGTAGNIQWQSSTNGISFTDITGANQNSYLTPHLTQMTYFRVPAAGICTGDSNRVFQIAVVPLPEPVLAASDTLFCSGDSVQICAGAGFSYAWNTNETSSCIQAKNPGGYWVTVTNNKGCLGVSDRVNVQVYPVPPVSIIVQGDTLSSFNAEAYQWYLNGNLIPGANSAVYVARESGEYSLEVTDANGCLSRSTGVNVIVNGIQYLENDFFIFYPNPFRNIFIMDLKHPEDIRSIDIYDVLGRSVFHREDFSISVSLIQADMTQHSDGMYFLKVRAEGGNIFYPIVKQQ